MRRSSYTPGFIRSAILLLLFCALPLPAETKIAHESAVPLDQLENKIRSILDRVDHSQYRSDEETLGYQFLLRSSFFSPFDYRIYGGRVSEKIPITLIRVEGPAGAARTIARVLEQENLFKDSRLVSGEHRSLSPKYQIVSHPLNLIAPWLATGYQSYHSPLLTRGQTWFRFLFYLSADLFFIYAGGTDWFRQGKWDPVEHQGNIIAGLAVMRLISAVQVTNLTRAHNRVAEAGYTFHF